MAEAVTLLLFASMLIGCVATDISVLYALAGGLICFCFYAIYCGHSLKSITAMIMSGLKNSRTILIVFILIGLLTAVWRAAGTVPCIVYYTASTITPRFYVALTFLLCCLMSVLTGTSFGSVSTMGVICISIGTALEVSGTYIAGAVMSGIYFGEQCSPMSSSALLVCQLTGTNIYNNIVRILKVAIVPFAVTLIIYLYMGRGWGVHTARVESTTIFLENFDLSPVTLIPAVIIMILSIVHLRVELTMVVSIIAAAVLCLTVQNMTEIELISCMIFGYRADTPELSSLLNGGGLISMVTTGMIVAISSAYFGIFSATKLLDHLKMWVNGLAQHSTTFVATLIVSVVTCAISCNQTLATMLTCEMTKDLVLNKEELAVNLTSSVLLIAAWIPWSIASAFPLSVLKAPASSLYYAVYLYLMPIWLLLLSLMKNHHKRQIQLFIKKETIK